MERTELTDPIIDLLYRLGSASLIPRTEEPCGAISGHAALNNGLVIRMMTRVAGRSARMAE